MNFLALRELVKTYLNREDLDAYIPHFINASIKKLENSLSLLDMAHIITDTVSETTKTITIPDNFKAVDYISVKMDNNNNKVLTPLDTYIYKVLCVNEKYSCPLFYSVDKNVINLYPLPDKEYQYEMRYYKYSEELISDTDENFWTLKYWPLLLYASLLEAEPFLVNDQRILAWKSYYDDAISKLINAEIQREFPGPMKIRGKGLDF